MASATKTIRQTLITRSNQEAWFAETKVLYNQVCAFYFEVIQAHPGILELSSTTALSALETLTHTTKANPHPVMPLVEAIPAMFRRAAIHAALGSAHSFYTHLEKWRKQKDKALARGKKFTIRPPVPPRSWNKSVICYAGQWKERTSESILLKVWTGKSWAWIKCHLQGRPLPDEWEIQSPTIVQDGAHWKLHTPLLKKFSAPTKAEQQVNTNPETRICAIDLNITQHLAVCTILTVEGTVVATRFISGGKQLHGLRKRQLGRIARKRDKTGIIAKDEQDNAALWEKIRHLNENAAHQVSHRIVQFAMAHQASILVFEHLGNFKPQQGKYSKRGNEKRAYWLRGKIFHFTKYKGWDEGRLLTCRVSPRNTSRECARCGNLVARYNASSPAEGYTAGAPLVLCVRCGMKGNADRNASIVIGKRLLARYQASSSHRTNIQEKPHAPLATERSSKEEGDFGSQDAERCGRPSTDPARQRTEVEQGTAQEVSARMGADAAGIPQQLRLFNES